MAITFSDEELAAILNLWCAYRNTAGTRLVLVLFAVNHTPSDDDDPAFYLGPGVQASFPGYTPQLLGPWPAAMEDEDNKLYYTTPPAVRFCRNVAGPAQVVYGCAALDETSGHWVWADKTWPGGISFATGCDCVNVAPTITDQDVTPGH